MAAAQRRACRHRRCPSAPGATAGPYASTPPNLATPKALIALRRIAGPRLCTVAEPVRCAFAKGQGDGCNAVKCGAATAKPATHRFEIQNP
jgi:hypothetical protein